jgi:hypothetical protein
MILLQVSVAEVIRWKICAFRRGPGTHFNPAFYPARTFKKRVIPAYEARGCTFESWPGALSIQLHTVTADD